VESSRSRKYRRDGIHWNIHLPRKGIIQKEQGLHMVTKSTRGLKLVALAAIATLGLCSASSVLANPIVNAGFEQTPDFTGYTTIGNTTLQAADFAIPVEGKLQALLSNSSGETTGGSNEVSGAQLETFLHLSAGTLTNAATFKANSGSAIQQTFSGLAGQTLTFKFDFLTNESPAGRTGHNDAAFLTLQNGANPTILAILADTNSSMHAVTDALSGAANFATTETGYLTYTTTLATSGTYTLGLGVINSMDGNVASGLMVDAINVSGGTSSVPLPLALLAAPLGAMVAGIAGKRARRAC